MLRDFELLPLACKQVLDHLPLLRVGFRGKQVFEMGNISPCNEPVHDYPQCRLFIIPTPNIAVIHFFVKHKPAG